jgi:pheromone shutdown-related protein TraB
MRMATCSSATATDPVTDTDPLAGQPVRHVVRDGIDYTLLGTAHVSNASVAAVRALIAQREDYDAVAVELCDARFGAMKDPDSMQRMDLFRVIREGKTGLVAANLALSAYQRRLAEQLDVEPGAEMKAAYELAEARGTDVWLIDRDVGITLRRTHAAVGFWQKIKLISGLAASVFVDEKVDEEQIEKLKQGDIIESAFHEFATQSEQLYQSLIAERDVYMAASLREHAGNHPGAKKVLAVVGAGHLAGLAKHLETDGDDPKTQRKRLDEVPPPGKWGTWLTILITVFVLGGFVYGFTQGADVGGDLILRWVLITGIGGALGCLASGGHPLSILGAFVASPLTPLHPALASGTISALIEAWVRRPTVADFGKLRDDVATPSGWWRNRVARTLLNFFLTSAGTAIGVWLAGATMLERLF